MQFGFCVMANIDEIGFLSHVEERVRALERDGLRVLFFCSGHCGEVAIDGGFRASGHRALVMARGRTAT